VSVTNVGDRVPTILEDPSGKRARWLRRVGRVVFIVFFAWLVATVLGGLGLIPVTGIPFAHVLRPTLGPPPIVKPLRSREPSASDLRPALPAVMLVPVAPVRAHGKGATVPSRTTTTTHGKSTVAPGQTRTTTTHGKSTTAPGRTKTTTTHGKSTVAPGQTRTATTHGKSTTAPGRTVTTTHGKKP
jgi:hypothetical protein